MTNEQYHNDISRISKSGLDKIESSPLDYWWHYLRPEREPHKPTKAMRFGTDLHAAALENIEFEKSYVVAPDLNKRTNIGKAEFNALTEMCEANDQVLISIKDYDNVKRMRDAIYKHPVAKILFGSGVSEQTILFDEENTGAPCKIRPDWINSQNGLIVDLKTTEDASPEGFAKSAYNFKYHKQDALYLDGMRQSGQEMSGFVFVCIEKTEPFKIGIYTLSERARQLGHDTYIENCDTYMQCKKSGIWKGYDEKIIEVSLPEWAFNQ
jgi:exodeoxyribonuclease VIII